MSFVMDRAQLQLMAEERILDAASLLASGRWAFAYYVAGYAVECALKSCVLSRMIYTGGVFTDKKFAEWCWTHDFGKLVECAGLRAELNGELAANPDFVGYWGTAILWKEISRYEEKRQPEAESLYQAVTNDPHGIMRWLRKYW